MQTEMAVPFASILLASIEKEILNIRHIDNVFSLWDANKEEIEHFIQLSEQIISTYYKVYR